jgi:hypothetical protein
VYTDLAFASIARKEGLNTLAALSITSIVLLALPKLYALGLCLVLMCGCGSANAREEDTRRKWAHRMLALNEARLQALNVEYTRYQREKTDLLVSALKFSLEDAP